MIYSGKKIMTVVGIVQGKEYIKSGTYVLAVLAVFLDNNK